MNFRFNNVDYDTTNYLSAFVDENTGEVHNERLVLNRNVRLLWFRSVYPQARVVKEVVCAGLPTETLKAMPAYSAEMPEEVFSFYKALAARGCSAAVAKASIYLTPESAQPEAVDYAVRYAEKGFSYNNEAALNAAYDRAICCLGFLVPEEIAQGVLPDGFNQSPAPAPAQNQAAASAIADIQKMLDSSESFDFAENDKPSANGNGGGSFDEATPVDQIVKLMPEDKARAYVIKVGKYKGKTVGEVYEATRKGNYSGTLDWFATKYTGHDNILKAACIIVNGKKEG